MLQFQKPLSSREMTNDAFMTIDACNFMTTETSNSEQIDLPLCGAVDIWARTYTRLGSFEHPLITRSNEYSTILAVLPRSSQKYLYSFVSTRSDRLTNWSSLLDCAKWNSSFLHICHSCDTLFGIGFLSLAALNLHFYGPFKNRTLLAGWMAGCCFETCLLKAYVLKVQLNLHVFVILKIAPNGHQTLSKWY